MNRCGWAIVAVVMMGVLVIGASTRGDGSQWEYKVVGQFAVMGMETPEKLQEQTGSDAATNPLKYLDTLAANAETVLNSLGDEGWEFVCATDSGYVFKRRK